MKRSQSESDTLEYVTCHFICHINYHIQYLKDFLLSRNSLWNVMSEWKRCVYYEKFIYFTNRLVLLKCPLLIWIIWQFFYTFLVISYSVVGLFIKSDIFPISPQKKGCFIVKWWFYAYFILHFIYFSGCHFNMT
jgi:hypothetical protein